MGGPKTIVVLGKRLRQISDVQWVGRDVVYWASDDDPDVCIEVRLAPGKWESTTGKSLRAAENACRRKLRAIAQRATKLAEGGK